jgi:hypothetical protein
MKRFLVSAACAAFIACGSSGSGGSASDVPTADRIGTVEPDAELIQLVGPEQLNWESGQIEMKFALRVTNHATEPITLRQIQIQTVGLEGPYAIPQSSYYFRTPVAAGETRSIEFFAKALSEGNKYRIDAQSPVSIRVIAFFEAPKGNFRKPFIANLGQSFKNNN